jgi:uncharacterized membrane protein YeaQ/YmgE (transglycosylase-associated protein family)
MYTLMWLIIIGGAIALLAMPLMQYLGRPYGRFGRTGDFLTVMVSTLAVGFLVGTLASLIGFFAEGTTAAAVAGFIGGLGAVVLLSLFSVGADASHNMS